MAVAWYDPAWRHRMLVTVDHTKVAATLTNYPWYVSGSDIVTAVPNFWDHVESTDGNDFLWTLDDGTTKIAHDMPHFSNGSGFESHALVASLSHATDTERYLYWGNRSAADQRNAAGVWGGYRGVWHAGEALGSAWVDSTGNGLNCSNVISPGAKAGKLYATGGDTLDAGDYATVPDASLLDLGPSIALSILYKPDNVVGEKRLFYRSGFGRIYANGTTINGRLYVGTAAYTSTSLTPALVAGAWHHIVMLYDRTWGTRKIQMYVNGAEVAYAAQPALPDADIDASNQPFNIGHSSASAQGVIDEARFGLIGGIDADWIATEHANQNAPSTFHSFGAIETYPGANLGEHWLMRTRRYP